MHLPIRSKYTKKSGRVIAKFDHYCYALGNAVGELNHGAFWRFLFVQAPLPPRPRPARPLLSPPHHHTAKSDVFARPAHLIAEPLASPTPPPPTRAHRARGVHRGRGARRCRGRPPPPPPSHPPSPLFPCEQVASIWLGKWLLAVAYLDFGRKAVWVVANAPLLVLNALTWIFGIPLTVPRPVEESRAVSPI